MKHLNKLIILVLLSVQALAEPAAFYSVSSVVEAIQEKHLDTHKALKIAPPDTLYHWISVKSAYRLFEGYSTDKPFPMKRMGNGELQSVLSSKVPVLAESLGLFTWHNPVGATVGGSSEIYGNNEAVMALKINPEARIGLIVTNEENYVYQKKLDDPRILKNYDLILHVTGVNIGGKFAAGYIEWLIVNPDVITDFTLDAKLIVKEMSRYKKALASLNSQEQTPAIEKLAGPQHTGLGSYSVNPDNISKLEKRILSYQPQLDDLSFHSGWHSRGNLCRARFK